MGLVRPMLLDKRMGNHATSACGPYWRRVAPATFAPIKAPNARSKRRSPEDPGEEQPSEAQLPDERPGEEEASTHREQRACNRNFDGNVREFGALATKQDIGVVLGDQRQREEGHEAGEEQWHDEQSKHQ